MRLNVIGYFTPFAAIPLTYLYLDKNVTINEKEGSDFNFQVEEVHLERHDWTNWVEYLAMNSRVMSERKKNDYVDFQTLLSFIASYLFFKFCCKIARLVVAIALISVPLWKLVTFTNTVDHIPVILSNETYSQIYSAISCADMVWNNHKPLIGDYVERFIYLAVNASLTDKVISSLLGAVTYLVVG